MSSPEEKQKKLKRRSNYAKALEKIQYHQRKVDAKKKIDVTKLTHKDLVDLIQEEDLKDG